MPAYVVVTTAGKASLDGFAQLLKALTQSPQWVAGTAQLIDHRNLDLSTMSPATIGLISELVKYHAAQLGPGRAAFVMSGALGILSSENYCFSENLPHDTARTFSSLEEATDWLLA